MPRGRVYASATDARQVYTIDAKTLKVTAKASAGEYPDGLAYDPVKKHVFVSDENGGIETVLDARGRRITQIALGGEAGNVQYDAGSNRMLVGVQSRNELAFIDPGFNEIVHRIKLSGCDGESRRARRLAAPARLRRVRRQREARDRRPAHA